MSGRNLIFVSPQKGELWMGGYPRGDDFEGIHCVVSMTSNGEWGQKPRVPCSVHIPLIDHDDELKRLATADQVRMMARSVAQMLTEGKNVLIHCGAGLNRSGVATARVLMELGMPAEMAINVVRTRRLPVGQALFNQGFVRWLMEEDGKPLPTAETSAFNDELA
jgi:hypothetical protein